MLRRNNFTMIELGAVIAIVIVLFMLFVITTGYGIVHTRFDGCRGNLQDLGKNFISYKLDENHFPCALKDEDSDGLVKEKVLGRNRSTIDVYNCYREYDNDDIDTKRFFCPASSCRQPRKRTSKLKISNVSYHYVNSNVSADIMKGNRALIRDLNEGHEEGKHGAVLLANGAVKKVKKIGEEKSKHNYEINWYRNKDDFENYQDFDHFLNQVSGPDVDVVD